MQRRIALLVAATTSAVVVAFIVPLCFLVASLAHDRAATRAREQAQNVATLLATVDDQPTLARTVADLDARGPRVWVVWPNDTVLGGQALPTATRALVERARREQGAFTNSSSEGLDALVAVATRSGVAVVASRVTDDELHAGVPEAWATMIALGLLLVAASVAVAVRLGRFIAVPVTEVAFVAHRLREGDVKARASLGGPPETVELGRALNALADRIHVLVGEEREQVADLGHRLRTPVTALRLDADLVTDEEVGARLRSHVDHLQRSIDDVVREARRPVATELVTATQLAPLVAQRVAFWTPLAEDQGRRLDLDVDVDAAAGSAVAVASADVADVVDSLLDNVFSHSPEGAPIAVRVQRRGAREGRASGSGDDVVTLVVEDGGPGLTTPWRGRGHSDAGSTGLGLAIVHRVVGAAGGHVELDRSALGGLRVTITLPAT